MERGVRNRLQMGGDQPEIQVVTKVPKAEWRGRARLRWVEGRRSPDGGWLHGNHHRGLCRTGCKGGETYLDTNSKRSLNYDNPARSPYPWVQKMVLALLFAHCAVTQPVTAQPWPNGCGLGGPSPCGDKPCLPRFPHTYLMQQSTIFMPCNYSLWTLQPSGCCKVRDCGLRLVQ